MAKVTEERQLQELKLDFTLSAVPNPFARSTRIQYTLPREAKVDIRVYDVLGREVGLVFSGVRNAGTHPTEFRVERLSSGVYYCRWQRVHANTKDSESRLSEVLSK